MVFGQVVGVHIDERFVDARGQVDTAAMQPIARCGYRDEYAVVRELFRMARPAPRPQWMWTLWPWGPKRAISSTGPSIAPNQCGVSVENSAASPGLIVNSSSPRLQAQVAGHDVDPLLALVDGQRVRRDAAAVGDPELVGLDAAGRVVVGQRPHRHAVDVVGPAVGHARVGRGR